MRQVESTPIVRLGDKSTTHLCSNSGEAEYVVHQIEKMVGGTSYFSLDSGRVTDDDRSTGRSFADFAVLYRLGALSQPLIEAFERSGIPFQTVGQTSFYEQQEIRQIMACLWFIYNPATALLLENVTSKKQLKLLRPFLDKLRNDLDAPTIAELIEQIHSFFLEHRFYTLDDKHVERVQQFRLRSIPFEHRLGDFLELTSLQKETVQLKLF